MDFRKKTHVPNTKKIPLVGAELFHADGRTVRQTGMMKLIVAFRNFTESVLGQHQSFS